MDADLLMACKMVTTEENATLVYDPSGMTCMRTFDRVETNFLPSDSVTVVGNPKSTPDGETLLNGDMCCTQGEATMNDDLLMACTATTTEDNIVHTWDPMGNGGKGTCTRSAVEITTYFLPSSNSMDTVGTKNALLTREETRDECCTASGEMGASMELREACIKQVDSTSVGFEWDNGMTTCTEILNEITRFETSTGTVITELPASIR